MPYQPINLGNLIAQAEGIKSSRLNQLATRQAMDPNSLKNQLLAAKIGSENAKAAGGGDPTSNMRDMAYLRKMIAEGYPEDQIELMRDAISKRWYGNVAGTPGSAQGGVFDPMSTIADEGAARAYEEYMKTQGGLQAEMGIPVPPPQPLGGVAERPAQTPAQAPVSKARLAAAVAGSSEKAKQREITAAAANRKKEELLGAAAAKTAEKAFEQIDKLNTSLFNLADGIAALESGAQSGPVAQFFPTIRESTIRLLNAQSRMGLDVVGAVTFGALSKGELDLALQTAMPTGLDEPELLQWMKDKQSAQIKLTKYLEEQVIFLSQPSNTQAKWLQKIQAGTAIDPRTAPKDNSGWTVEAIN